MLPILEAVSQTPSLGILPGRQVNCSKSTLYKLNALDALQHSTAGANHWALRLSIRPRPGRFCGAPEAWSYFFSAKDSTAHCPIRTS